MLVWSGTVNANYFKFDTKNLFIGAQRKCLEVNLKYKTIYVG